MRCYAAGFNVRWLLRGMVRLGLKGLYLRLIGLLTVLAMALESTASHSRMRAARGTGATR